MAIVLPTQRTMPATQVKDYLMMFYGPAGVGKTTFVDQLAERVLFLSTDRGTRFLTGFRLECNSYSDFDEVVTALEHEVAAKKGATPYDIVCVDHVDDFANIAELQVLEDFGIESLSDAEWGKAYKAHRMKIESFVHRLLGLHMGVVFIAHEKSKEVKIQGLKQMRVEPLLGKSAWNVVVPIADLIGYCGQKQVLVDATNPAGKAIKVKKEVRSLETIPRATMLAKDRTRRQRPTGDYELLDARAFIKTFGDSSIVGSSNHGNEFRQPTEVSNGRKINHPSSITQSTSDAGSSTSEADAQARIAAIKARRARSSAG